MTWYPDHAKSQKASKLTHLLHSAPVDDAAPNAYLVHVLDSSEATEAVEVIVEAFEQGKVDERTIDPESVDIWDDLDLYDRLYGQR